MATALMVFATIIFCMGVLELPKDWRGTKADLLIIGGATLLIIGVVIRAMGVAE